jgi:hypothetical protein
MSTCEQFNQAMKTTRNELTPGSCWPRERARLCLEWSQVLPPCGLIVVQRGRAGKGAKRRRRALKSAEYVNRFIYEPGVILRHPGGQVVQVDDAGL